MGAAVTIGGLAMMFGVVQQMTAAAQGPQIGRVVVFRHVIQMRGGENHPGPLASSFSFDSRRLIEAFHGPVARRNAPARRDALRFPWSQNVGLLRIEAWRADQAGLERRCSGRCGRIPRRLLV